MPVEAAGGHTAAPWRPHGRAMTHRKLLLLLLLLQLDMVLLALVLQLVLLSVPQLLLIKYTWNTRTKAKYIPPIVVALSYHAVRQRKHNFCVNI